MLTEGFRSTFTFPTFTFPSYSFESSSITGPIARQGPHHSAQKSITDNFSESKTFVLKFASVNSCAIIFYCFYFLMKDQNYIQMFEYVALTYSHIVPNIVCHY